MKSTRLIIAVLSLAMPFSVLLAQDAPPAGQPPGENDGPGPGRGHHHRPPPSPIFVALDANHDGVLSADEIANAPAALKTLDKNGDGQLTRDELMPPRPPQNSDTNAPADAPPPGDDAQGGGHGRHHRPPPPLVDALDTNHDGVISADEIANASASLLKLDKNGDGKLTMDELMPHGPRRGGNGPDGNGPDGDGQRPPPPDQDQK